ncbi:glutathione S-transferase [Paraburkholderia sp. Tr-20389]|uniref:glutathione S-transferase N-terminal domain-containing protein n=1 Tax=Paraburkholderia sp. Tr-20389 TaxID=2703903 RepID=UPI001981927F|nr:glutathione S-transferase N-terminal domain-containing protein [Paraburkholderia sp. Tr-20389]MBN3753271.1 glutathione S-transferase [Paraburkholderia sp. Tr-20389]
MLKLYCGTKKYSSWSLRPWSLLREAAVLFEEIVIPFEAIPGSREFTDDFKQAAALVHPSSRVPVLHDGSIVIWETLAICEYVSQEYCDGRLWPHDRATRAFARSLATELQSEFALIRSTFPFWCTRRMDKRMRPTGAVGDEWERLTRGMHIALEASGGPFLFGEYSIVDAMVLPMMSRASTYLDITDSLIGGYLDFVLSRASYCDWVDAAHHEPVILLELERYANALAAA